jgi:hypothetical protein
MLGLEGTGMIAPMAQKQLQRWRELADRWPWSNNEGAYTCGDCGTMIHQIHDSWGNPYLITSDELSALEVAHLHIRHEGALPDGQD